MRQSVRCVALGLLSAAAVASIALPASAGLLDGGWGCGCGGPAYYGGGPYYGGGGYYGSSVPHYRGHPLASW